MLNFDAPAVAGVPRGIPLTDRTFLHSRGRIQPRLINVDDEDVSASVEAVDPSVVLELLFYVFADPGWVLGVFSLLISVAAATEGEDNRAKRKNPGCAA